MKVYKQTPGVGNYLKYRKVIERVKTYMVKTDDVLTENHIHNAIRQIYNPETLDVKLYSQRKMYECPYDACCSCAMVEPCVECEVFDAKEAEGM